MERGREERKEGEGKRVVFTFEVVFISICSPSFPVKTIVERIYPHLEH